MLLGWNPWMNAMDDTIIKSIRNRRIIDCLDGDSKEFEKIGAKLPYLRGTEICELLENRGIPFSYGDHHNSRWFIMEEMLQEAFSHNILDDILTSIITKATLVDESCAETKQSRIDAINLIVEHINAILMFDGVELNFIGNRIHICTKTTSPNTDKIKEIDIATIDQMIEKARTDLSNKDYDSVITKSRTILEEVLLYALNASSNPEKYGGNIGKMTKDLIKMLDSSNVPKPIHNVVHHIVELISNIAHIRNNYSDSHARGCVRTTLSASESKLILDCSMIVSEYLISIIEEGSLADRTKCIKSTNQCHLQTDNPKYGE